MDVCFITVVLLAKCVLGSTLTATDDSQVLQPNKLFNDEDNCELLKCIANCRSEKACPPESEIKIEFNNVTCTNTCSSNEDCLERQACCITDCGKQCILSDHFKYNNDFAKCHNQCKQKLEGLEPVRQCPASEWLDMQPENCNDQCLSDEDCLSFMKCCETGCGKYCMAAQDLSCVSNGIVYENGQAVVSALPTHCVCKKGRITCVIGPKET